MIEIDGVSFYKLDNIDVKKTARNGKKICLIYRPLVEKRIRQLLIPMNSTSLMKFSDNATKRNSFEDKLINRCNWTDDNLTNFIYNIFNLIKCDYLAGMFLKEKYIYDQFDEEIAKKLNVSRRTLYLCKERAYYKMAIWCNQVEYIKDEDNHFEE